MKSPSKRRRNNNAGIENYKEDAAQTNFVTSATKTTNFTITNEQNSQIQHIREQKEHNSSVSSIVTPLTGTEFCNGNMFDIKTFKNVTISFFEIHTELFTNVSYFIYTRNESYESDTLNRSTWTLISSGEVQGMGKGNAIATNSFSQSLFLPSNTTQAFYITLDKANLLSTVGSDEGATVISDSNLEIREGISVMGFPFGPVIYRPRIFNGAIHYSVIEHSENVTKSVNDTTYIDSQILQSSHFPSSNPTNVVSLSPSYAPTINNRLKSSHPSNENYEGNRKRIHGTQPTSSSDIKTILEQKNGTSSLERIKKSWSQMTYIPFHFTMLGELNFTDYVEPLNSFNLAIQERLFSTLFQSGNVKDDQLEIISVDTKIIESPTFQRKSFLH